MTEEPRRPEIEYPAEWTYTLIGVSEGLVRDAVLEILGERQHELSPSHTSSKGTYHSMSLVVEVRSEADRLGLFDSLRNHPHLRFVL